MEVPQISKRREQQGQEDPAGSCPEADIRREIADGLGHLAVQNPDSDGPERELGPHIAKQDDADARAAIEGLSDGQWQKDPVGAGDKEEDCVAVGLSSEKGRHP